MGGFSIDISNTLNFEKVSGDLSGAVDDELNSFGLDTVAMAKELCPVDEGFLRNSITFEKENLSVTIIAAAFYAAYVEFGTRKFAAEYAATLPANWQEYAATFIGGAGTGDGDFFNKILAWMERKGIDKKLAYPIARNILINGVKAQPFFYPAIFDNEVKLINNLNALLK